MVLAPNADSVSPSQALLSRVRLAEPRLHAAADRFWRHAELRALFAPFMIQLFHVVRGGLDLMSLAASRAESLFVTGDPAAGIIADYLRHHLEEECDHADWLLRDLAVLGVAEAQVLQAEPLPSIVSLLGAQSFRIASVHPVCVFGYLLVLEGSPPLASQLHAIANRTGLPPEAFRCLLAHAEDDPGHLADLNSTLDRLPLTSEQSRGIALSAFAAVDGVASVLEALIVPSEQRRMAGTASHA